MRERLKPNWNSNEKGQQRSDLRVTSNRERAEALTGCMTNPDWAREFTDRPLMEGYEQDFIDGDVDYRIGELAEEGQPLLTQAEGFCQEKTTDRERVG